MAAARARGRLGGHPTLDPKQVDLALKMYDSKTCTVAQITRATGVSKSALYTYLHNRKRQ
jgi:Helix-turn-helix domain of resolvase.